MEIVLIRHGEPDYAPCDERGFIGHGMALAPLTQRGIEQAEEAAKSDLLSQSEIIVSSPYTRALQTAAILSRVTGIKIVIEMDLREWEPDKTYQYKSFAEVTALFEDYCACKGVYPEGEKRNWEETDEMIERIRPVIHSYYEKGYQKIIIAAHGGVIKRLVGGGEVPYCTPRIVHYNGSFDYFGWVE